MHACCNRHRLTPPHQPTYTPPHRRFLNRLLGLPVARQNLLYNYFAVRPNHCAH